MALTFDRSNSVVGIDLGTTNSLVAVMRGGAPVVLGDPDLCAPGRPSDGPAWRAPEGSGGAGLLLPSVVRYSADGARAEAVGWGAKRRAVEWPERTVASVKRLMGRSARDAAGNGAGPGLSYRVVDGPNDTARIAIGDRLISAPEVSGVILGALRDRAARALGVDVRRAVITVPAYFDDAQRQATRDAARLAGLEAVRIINEPTAAALAYGVGLRLSKPATIAVFDLGGGTFDISILRVTPARDVKRSAVGGGLKAPAGEHEPVASQTDPAFFEVLATAGDTRLGGDDVDQALLTLFLREIGERFGVGLAGAALGGIDPSTMQALREFAEAAKVRLSGEAAAQVRVDLGADSRGAARIYERAIAREEFEAIIRPWVDRTIARCKQALRDARLTPADIDTVALVGGSTRIPLVRRVVGEFFGKEPYTALDPDLVVAMGAAVQAGLLDGSASGAVLLDVLPLSLGVETVGGGVAKLIVRNSNVPARATEMFSTSVDGQTSIKINIVQGEREMVADCRSLGVFHLSGIPPMPAGMPQVEVEFLVDANGILGVSALERRSGARARLQVVPNHGLTREEVERMEAEAFANAREDMTRHRIADLVVNARMDIKWTRDAIAKAREKLGQEYLGLLESSLTALAELAADAERDWRNVDPDVFHRAKEALDRSSVRLHEVAITENLQNLEKRNVGR